MNRFFLLFPACCLALLGLSGCTGYQLGDVKPSAYEGIDNLHVPIFRNQTLEPRLSSLVTNAVLKELHVDGTYKITNRASCDAILVGEVREIRKTQLRAQRNDTLSSQELQVTLYVDFYLEDPVSGNKIVNTSKRRAVPIGDKSDAAASEGAILARQGTVTGQTIQFVDASFQTAERYSFSVAAQDAAAKLVASLANGF
ncbi:MAG: LPS assembly lipoprotein LptE [Verrucomicrobiales bacterium]|nr:LPS assembly lipoprotein LptE [Verrucomicrobiales bacterium]